jgi:predicted lipoprotein with Yx(FWY)xxD motif
MNRSKPINFLAAAAAVPLAALVVAASGSGASAASAARAAPQATNARSATVKVASRGLGKILVDSRGRTLYLFKKDSGTKSACFGACAQAWPPLQANGKPTVGGGLKASKVGTTRRSDGKPQVTYNGHPLYRFEGDNKPGDTNGQGLNAFGARWYALTPAGNQVSRQPSNSGGGGGY